MDCNDPIRNKAVNLSIMVPTLIANYPTGSNLIIATRVSMTVEPVVRAML